MLYSIREISKFLRIDFRTLLFLCEKHEIHIIESKTKGSVRRISKMSLLKLINKLNGETNAVDIIEENKELKIIYRESVHG